MAKRSSSSEESVDISDLEKEIAALKAEVAQLKKDLAAASKSKASGGTDPRLDKLITFVKHFYRANVRTSEDAKEMSAIEKEIF